jgi:hypothetical protein
MKKTSIIIILIIIVMTYQTIYKNQCSIDSDCKENFYCYGSKLLSAHFCKKKPKNFCRIDKDCKNGLVCNLKPDFWHGSCQSKKTNTLQYAINQEEFDKINENKINYLKDYAEENLL